jgi:hypothetical protein
MRNLMNVNQISNFLVAFSDLFNSKKLLNEFFEDKYELKVT